LLSLIDQPDGPLICADVYGARMGHVPYIMPASRSRLAPPTSYDVKPTVEDA